MTDPKEKPPPQIKTRPPGRLSKGGMFDRVRLPEGAHPIAEILSGPSAPAQAPADAPAAEPSQPQYSQPESSQPPKPAATGYGSRPQENQPQRSQPEQGRPQRSQPQPSQLDMMAALPEVSGHTEMPHQIVDHLYPFLDPFEQAAFTQLYRLSWGYKNNRCRISNDRLAERAGMSVAKLKQVTRQLESKGLIKKVDRPHGQNVIQGVEYEVRTSSWQLRRSQPQRSQPEDSQPSHAPNKDKELKEITKDGASCPDCFGTGMWYPEGYSKGVARCAHARMKREPPPGAGV